MADSYSRWVMTDAFANNSQAAINAGQKIEWVSIKTSDDSHTFNDLSGFNDTTLATATIRQTTNISSVTITGKTVTITGLFNSNNNTADYYIRTMFLVARYNGKEFLAGATVANSSATAFRMPAASGTEITEFTARPQISVSNTSTISATVNPVASATNERVDSLEENLQDQINASNTDKQNLWNRLADYVTKAKSETIDGIKTFTQTIVGSITGNAGTATKLQTGRRINGTVFDGTSDINVPASNDENLVHKSGNETLSGNKTFSDETTFNNQINGSLKTRYVPVFDFNTLASDTKKYSGFWFVADQNVANGPTGDVTWGTIEVVTGNTFTTGFMKYTRFLTGETYITGVNGGIMGWYKVAKDNEVMHLSGDEVVNGSKNFKNTATFEKMINGALKTRIATFTDFSQVATNMEYYAGNWVVKGGHIGNSPVPDNYYMVVEVIPGDFGISGKIMVTPYDSYVDIEKVIYYAVIKYDGVINWQKIARDNTVIHNFGDETAAGFKKFSGNIATTSDNSMINGGGNNGDIALVKKNGTMGALVVGQNNSFSVKQSAGASVLPTDVHTKFFEVNTSGGVYAGTNLDLVPLDKNVIHKSGNETLSGNKTFSDETTFNNQINGSLKTRYVPVFDFNTLASDTKKYSGFWFVADQNVANGPTGDVTWGTIEVVTGNTFTTGFMKYTRFLTGETYITGVNGGIQGWKKLSDDGSVVHKSGAEVVGGNKEFIGTTTLAKGVSKSVVQKSITTTAPITLNFAETAFGVNVYASASGTFMADGIWHSLATLPSEITPPYIIATLNDVDWAGVGGVTNRSGYGIKIAIKPNREITYKVTSLKENDNTNRNIGTTFDLSTYWSK